MFVCQVVHHPTVIAAHGEGERWTFAGDAEVRSKFWGRSIELIPVGLIRLKFDDGDEYNWTKVIAGRLPPSPPSILPSVLRSTLCYACTAHELILAGSECTCRFRRLSAVSIAGPQTVGVVDQVQQTCIVENEISNA